MNPWGMDCDELVELVTDYLEGALSEEDRRNFEKHTSMCKSCAHYLEQIKLTSGAVRQLSKESIPPQTMEALLHTFRNWRKM
jgi:anti-sigma factor RsiW